jgi:SET domain-containing protein
MLLIDCTLKDAGKKGIGVFTNEFIVEGSTVWEHDPIFHKKIYLDEYECLDPVQKAFIDKYATLEKEDFTYYYLDLDNTRFVNHSDSPNIEFDKTEGRAIRSIEIGEEITCDYLKIYDRLWFEKHT